MSDLAKAKPTTVRRWRPTVRDLRLYSGIVLFAYVASHFLNHALGLISLDALESGRRVFLWLWRNPVGTTLLYGSLLVHFGLALQALYARGLLKMSRAEWIQIVLGFAIPFFLALHVYGTRGAHEFYGVQDSYAYVLLAQWYFSPSIGIQQVVLFAAAWIHGCMGLYYYLRLKPFFAAAFPYLLGVALLVPTFGLLGVAEGAKTVVALAADPAWLEAALASSQAPASAIATIYGATYATQAFVALSILGAIALRYLRRSRERRKGVVTVTYPPERRVETAPGPSILEISRMFGIPHASVCGGRGRCSTCRVKIVVGLEGLDPSEPAEVSVLERIGAPPDVRLACQTRPKIDIGIVPLVVPGSVLDIGRSRAGSLAGREREMVILFADLRNFTGFAEKKLPYDVVFILNQYFNAMGSAISNAGGRVDKFLGDGVMALFGIEQDITVASRQALVAIEAMARNLGTLNATLRNDLAEPLRMGIGLHAGPVIVGEMGFARATSVTAIGDAVNTASRLEALTKEFGVQAVVSDKVAEYAGIDFSRFEARDVSIRGRRDPLSVRLIPEAVDLLPETPVLAAE